MDDVSKLGPLWVSQLRQTVTERRNRAAESLLTINPDGDYAKHHRMLIDAADAMLAAPELLLSAKAFIKYDHDGINEGNHTALMFLYADALRLAKDGDAKASGAPA